MRPVRPGLAVTARHGRFARGRSGLGGWPRVLGGAGGVTAGRWRASIKVICDLIWSNGTTQKRISCDDAQVGWMEKLHDFDRAFDSGVILRLVAQCRIAYTPIPGNEKYDRIIVDEAQDVSPIEWNVLDQYLTRDGQWTLVGDMNQRRSDTTFQFCDEWL